MIHWKRRIFFIVGNIVLLMTLSGCGLGGGGADEVASTATLGSDASLAGDATLICSDACAARAQCGTNPEAQPVILVNTVGPAVEQHDRWMPNNTAVAITNVQERTVEKISTFEQYPMRFYEVLLPDNQGIAWVAGWCIQQ